MTNYSEEEKLASSSSRGSPRAVHETEKIVCDMHKVAEENEIACIMSEDATKNKFLLHTKISDLSALKVTPHSPSLSSLRGDRCISIKDSDMHGIELKYARFLDEKQKKYHLRKFKKFDRTVPPLRDIMAPLASKPLRVVSEDDEKMILEDLSQLETEMHNKVAEENEMSEACIIMSEDAEDQKFLLSKLHGGDRLVSLKDSDRHGGTLYNYARFLDEKIIKKNKCMEKFTNLDSVLPVPPLRDIMAPNLVTKPLRVVSEDDEKMILEDLCKLETRIYVNEEQKIEKSVCEMHKVAAEKKEMAKLAYMMFEDAEEKFQMMNSKTKRAYQTVDSEHERKRRIKDMLPSFEPAYLGDIYKHFQEEEKKNAPIYDYLAPNFIMGFGPNYRQRLVNWLIEAGDKLLLNQFIICQTVAYFDYYFSVIPTSDMEKDPVLVGIVCLRIASRYVGRVVPDLKSLISFSKVSDLESNKKWSSKNIVKEDMVVMMEDLIVRKMNYCLGRPTAKTFVQMFKAVDEETSHRDFDFVSEFLINFSLLAPDCIMRLPSLVAASIFFLAKVLIIEDYSEQPALSLKVVEFSGYRFSDMEKCIVAIHSFITKDVNAAEARLLAMKYEMQKRSSRYQHYANKLSRYSTEDLREIVTAGEKFRR